MDVNSDNHICVGKLDLVEFAGSEKVAKTAAQVRLECDINAVVCCRTELIGGSL